jgi:RimJ/RimL family protein N-acetyltransferase
MPALEADEATFNVQIAVIEAALKAVPEGFLYWDLGAPGQIALKSPGRSLLLGLLDADGCRRLVELTENVAYRGVVGPEPCVSEFVNAASMAGIGFEPPVPMQIHVLDTAPRFPGAPGTARELDASDAPLLFAWMTAFHREAVPHDPPPQLANVETAAASGRYLFWTLDGEPVSVAAINRPLRSVSAIGAVYTPPAQRAKGYAGSVVAALSARILSDSKRRVCLYTDLRNPASNRCYAKVGFRPHRTAAHYLRA